MTFAAVGSGGGSLDAATSITYAGAGNLVLCEAINYSNTTVHCTGLTGSGITWVQAGVSFAGTNVAYNASVFLGTVTGTGAQTITPTWSGTTPGYSMAAHEFSSTVGSWAFDKQGNLDSSAATGTWPSLTPGFGAGELYWGFALVNAAMTAGTTTGFTWNTNADASSDIEAYNPACGSGAIQPVWGSTATGHFGIMVLVNEAAGGGGTNTSPAWAASYDTTAVAGTGTWTNPANAEGTGGSGGPWATWTAP